MEAISKILSTAWLCAAFLVSMPAQSQESLNIEAVRDQILAGVSTLVDPTQPGHMVVYGQTAYSISNYPGGDLSDPMIAVATMGQGRVVAMPDHQWLNMGSYGSDPSMAAFYLNSIDWLANTSSQSIKIVTWNNQANADWLTAQGYTNVVNTNSAALASDLAGASAFVSGWLGSSVSDTVLNTIESYVMGGGGLFIAEYGIGYDWWWNKETPDIPANRLLRTAGIGFTTDWPYSGAQAINRAVGQVTYNDILALLIDSSSATQAEKNQAAGIYDKLNEVLANDDPLQIQLDTEFWARIDAINPTPASPVTDSFEKALLKREMNLIKDLPAAQVTAHRTAESVYGTVAAAAPRLIGHTVSLNTDITGWLATGMYAAPGEVVTLAVPAALVGQGYQVRISGHKDNISGRSDWNRVPYGASRSFDLNSTTHDIASAFGGAIYIDVGGTSQGIAPNLGDIDIIMDGAVEAPMFVLNQTTNVDWINSIRDNPAPYAEFVSDRLAFSVPSSWIRSLDDAAALMTYWDEAVDFQDWVGGFESLRSGSDRINVDVQISVGLLHAGYPIQGPVSYGDRLVNLTKLETSGDWGWFHELGHMMQVQPGLGWGYNNPWTFDGDTEVTVNIFANAALEMMVPATGTGGWGYSAHSTEVMTQAADTVNDLASPNFEDKNPYPFYFQLADGPWGWQGYRDVLSGYIFDQLNNPGDLPQDNLEEKDQWLIRWSQQNGYDMTGYMVNQWSLEVSSAALGTVAAMALPDWMPLACSVTSLATPPGITQTVDLVAAGSSLDGVATLVSVGAASNGTVTDNGNGIYTYTPNAAFSGNDAFTATYESSAGNQQSFTVDVRVSSQGVLLESFNNIAGSAVSDLTSSANYPDNPDLVAFPDSFEAPTNVLDNYGLRGRAHVTVPTTGSYTFWIASDDNSELWLSSDSDAANASLIASVPNWTSSQQWDKYPSQQSIAVVLNAGEQYYIEALMKEGGGGDNLAVAWSGPGIAGPTVIDGQYLTIYGLTQPDTTPPSITAPANVSVESSVPVSVALGTPSVSDIADPSPSVTNDAPALFPVGVSVVTWTATDASGNSAIDTQTVTVSAPVAEPPAAPSSLDADIVKTGKGKKKVIVSVTLNWIDNAGNEDGFEVERCEEIITGRGKKRTVTCDFAPYNTTGANTTSLAVGTEADHRYRVRAFNASGVSAWSNEVKVQ